MAGARPLSDEEVNKILEHGFTGSNKIRNQALFALGLSTGYRIRQLLSLKVKDVVNPDGTLKDRIYIPRRHNKGKKLSVNNRISTRAKEYLHKLVLIASVKGHTYLFKSRQRDEAIDPSQAWRVLEKAFRTAKAFDTRGTHAMRKTFATKFYDESGHNLIKTRDALGHTNTKTTEHYLSYEESDIQSLIEKVF
jgi:integrase